MRAGMDTLLLGATLVLAGVSAILSSSPVRQALDEYLSAPDDTAMMIGQSMTEDPARPGATRAPGGD